MDIDTDALIKALGVGLGVILLFVIGALAQKLWARFGVARLFLALLFVLWVASILYPPWVFLYGWGITKPAGYWLIFEGPPDRYTRIDFVRLGLQWFGLASVAAVAWLWSRKAGK